MLTNLLTDIARPSVKDIEVPGDFSAQVHRPLYTIIKEYSRCCCAQSGEHNNLPSHEGRLRLRENVQLTDEHAIFDVVFSRNQYMSSAHGIEWEHIQFKIPKTRYLED